MSADTLGRGLEALPIEDQVQALRDHAVGQELLTRILIAAVQKLGLDFMANGEPLWADEPAPAPE